MLTLLVKLYAQFHPSKAFEVRAVVLAKRKTPVKTVKKDCILWVNELIDIVERTRRYA